MQCLHFDIRHTSRSTNTGTQPFNVSHASKGENRVGMKKSGIGAHLNYALLKTIYLGIEFIKDA